MHPPFSQACENNQAPILAVLQPLLADHHHVLEIGSGTGQHSVFFAPQLPQLTWQTSDLPVHLPGITAWHQARPAANLPPPLAFDLAQGDWPVSGNAQAYDAVFTSNTAHIVAWPLVQRMFALVASALPAHGVFAMYGPFNYAGRFTSPSNQAFDAWLRQRDAASGIRDIEDMQALAAQHGMHAVQDTAMPANNRLLVWRNRPA